MTTGLELALAAKLATIIKGAVVVSSHQPAAMMMAKGFISIAHASGLIEGITWLIAMLSALGIAAGLISSLEDLGAIVKTCG